MVSMWDTAEWGTGGGVCSTGCERRFDGEGSGVRMYGSQHATEIF